MSCDVHRQNVVIDAGDSCGGMRRLGGSRRLQSGATASYVRGTRPGVAPCAVVLRLREMSEDTK